jgi:hypothetical protein
LEIQIDPDLKEFARQTLPKIEDHLERALKLANATDVPGFPEMNAGEAR